MKRNKLNDLSPTDWIKFQKSWFVHNPPRRRRDLMLHPAKFPETLAQLFIEFFTKAGMNVLDPMVGTGSTLVACVRSGRNGYGIELNPRYAAIAEDEVRRELEQLPQAHASTARVITADARRLPQLGLPTIDYCITSPPYWDMLRMKGDKTQRKRRREGLDVAYSDDPNDLGNIADYDSFVQALAEVYRGVHAVLRPQAYFTVIVKNVKKRGRVYPLAWDVGREIGKFFILKDERIWCQDNQRLAPWGLGNAWVSNTHHQYCLNFRKE